MNLAVTPLVLTPFVPFPNIHVQIRVHAPVSEYQQRQAHQGQGDDEAGHLAVRGVVGGPGRF